MSEPVALKNIGAKILKVMEGVGSVSKDKKNAFHGYNYVSDEAIVSKIREEMIRHKLIVVPNQKTCTLSQEKNAKGDTVYLTSLEVEYTMIDPESGESIRASVFGYGKDKEDKGVYKAATGAEKYFLLKTFLIPTSDDPEATGPASRPQSRTATPPPAVSPKTPPSAPPVASAKPPAPGIDSIQITGVERFKNKTGNIVFWKIMDSEGVVYATFSEEVSKVAMECAKAKQSAIIEFVMDTKGPRITKIKPAPNTAAKAT